MQVLTRGFGSSIPTFVGFMPIWMSWLWLDRIIMFLFVLSKKVSDRRHLSELCTPGFGRPQQRLRKSTPGARVWLLMLEKDSAPSEREREREREQSTPGARVWLFMLEKDSTPSERARESERERERVIHCWCPGWLFMLEKKSAPSERTSLSVLPTHPVFHICSMINTTSGWEI